MIFASLSGMIACSAMNAHPIDYIVMSIIMIFGFLLYPSGHMFDSDENWPVRRSPRDVEDGEQDYEAKRAEIRERAAEMRNSESEKKDIEDANK